LSKKSKQAGLSSGDLGLARGGFRKNDDSLKKRNIKDEEDNQRLHLMIG
jgi:hypothetical protein